MRKVQQRGLLLVVGLLGVVLLGLVGCGGTSGDGNSAGRTSRVVLQITTAEQAGGDALRQAGVPTALRAVPTDPNDPAFISRLVIEVTGAGIPSPITQTVTLTAAQQEQVEVELQIPTGEDGRIVVNIIVDAFHTADGVDTKIFHGEALGVDLPRTEPVEIPLEPVLLPGTPDTPDTPDTPGTPATPDTTTTTTVHITFPRQVVPTDPSDPAFVSRVDVQVEGEGIPTPVTQSVTLTAAQQTEVTVENLVVPTGPNRRITVNAFNSAGTLIFDGDVTTDLLDATVTVPIPLSRVLVPEAVTPSDLADKAFAFADGAAFGIGSPAQPQAAILQFGTFTGDTGSFTLTSAGQTATGNVTILPPASTDTSRRLSPTGTPRQGETSTSCTFALETSGFSSNGEPQAEQTLRMNPCEVDAFDGNLILVNADTNARSTSAFPTPVGNAVPDGIIETPAEAVTIVTGETVTFTATCRDPDNTIPLNVVWDFGGGAPPVLVEDPGAVRFDTPGTFTVTLACTDALGASDPTPDTRTVTVLRPETIPLNAVHMGSPAAPVAANGVFTVPVVFNAGGVQVLSYLFELTFDRNVVEVLNIQGLGPFSEVITNVLAFPTGAVRFAANSAAFTPAVGLINLANILFQVVGNSGEASALVLRFPATPGGTGVVVDETFQAIEGITFIDGSVQVQ